MWNKNLGNAGEFYVLAQLAQRGYIAGKTDDGQTLIDVIATDEESLRTVNIQVKTTGANSKVPQWVMSKKNEQPHDSLWYVLVEGQSQKTLPNFYIFHSSEGGPCIEKDHQDYLERNDHRSDSSVRKFRPTDQELAKHRGLHSNGLSHHQWVRDWAGEHFLQVGGCSGGSSLPLTSHNRLSLILSWFYSDGIWIYLHKWL